MKTIWKYFFEFPQSTIAMPKGAKIVHVDVQRGEPQMWVLVESTAEKELRTFVVHGTGHPIPEYHKYVGTYQEAPFVWHIFEEVRE